jgi:hypothetical protein
MTKWTPEYARAYRKEYAEKNKERLKEWRLERDRRIREQRKAETGSTYDKASYEKYKPVHAAACKRWRMKKKQAMLQAGLLKAPPTPEEREARKEATRQRQKEKYQYRYKNNIDGFRDRSLEKQRRAWREDEVRRERSRQYVREHRARKRAELLPQRLDKKRQREEAKALAAEERDRQRRLKRDAREQIKLQAQQLKEEKRRARWGLHANKLERQLLEKPQPVEEPTLPRKGRKSIISHTQALASIKKAISQNNWEEVRRLNALIKSRLS